MIRPCRRTVFAIFLLGLTLVAIWPAPAARGQADELWIEIIRPGQDETYYSGPGGPRTLVSIIGRTGSSSFEPSQLEVRIELLQDGRAVGNEITTPDSTGHFSLQAMINALGTDELGTPEANCYVCHEQASLALPKGASVVRTTVVEPTGRTAVAERAIQVDQADLARVRVRTRLREHPDRAVPGLPVDASVLIYEWRARKFTALTDSQGEAVLNLEASSLRPLRYRLAIAPVLLDGVLYQAAVPVEFTVPPGAIEMAVVDLVVEAQLGRISGMLVLDGKPLGQPMPVSAVALPYGHAYTDMAVEGAFAFGDLPFGRYLITADTEAAAEAGYKPVATQIDLMSATDGRATLAVTRSPGPVVRGRLRDSSGGVLPFGWVTADGAETTCQAAPASGRFVLSGLPAGTRTLRASAPGHYGRVIPARAGTDLEVMLVPMPTTREAPWGAGQLVIPDGTLAELAGDRVQLRRGWLWGSGGDRPLTVATSDGEITIRSGSFAVEYLPGETAWLYLTAGEAEISRSSGARAKLGAGQMCAFAGKDVVGLEVAPLDETVWRAMQGTRRVHVAFEAEPGAWPRVRDMLAVTGIQNLGPAGAAASLLGVCAALTAAVLTVRHRRRRPRAANKSEDSWTDGPTDPGETPG